AARRDPAHRSGERPGDGGGRRERAPDRRRGDGRRRAQRHRVDPRARALRHHRQALAAPLRDRALAAHPMKAELPIVPEEAPRDPYLVRGWDARAPGPGLPPRSLRAARAIAEALFAREDGPPPPARLDWLAADLGDFFGHVTLRARLL